MLERNNEQCTGRIILSGELSKKGTSFFYAVHCVVTMQMGRCILETFERPLCLDWWEKKTSYKSSNVCQ